jgi:hypothetical protein
MQARDSSVCSSIGFRLDVEPDGSALGQAISMELVQMVFLNMRGELLNN